MPKYATIGDYWDEEMVSKVTKLLHEYQDLFPMKFSEMKGILWWYRSDKNTFESWYKACEAATL